MKRKEKRIEFILGFIVLVIVSLFIIFEVYLWVTYGNKLIEEIPLWVLWFLWGK